MAFNDGIHIKPEKLKKKELLMMKNAYPKGKRVVAVFVDGVKEGKKGTIKEVKENGDIRVAWEDGRETNVKYLMESIRVLCQKGCMLGYKRIDGDDVCEEGLICETCGWNYEVAEKRKAKIRAGKMVRGEDGTDRIVV